MDIFEQYFYDLNQFGRLPGNSMEYSDMLNYLEEKISLFEQQVTKNINTDQTFYNIGATISDLYRIGTILYNDATCEKVNANTIEAVLNSPLLKPTTYHPVYVLRDKKIYIYPTFIKDPIVVNYIKKPTKVQWGYTVVSGTAMYDNGTDTIDFELHESEETDLVIKILQLAGITLKDSSLYEITATEDNKNIQQEKQ